MLFKLVSLLTLAMGCVLPLGTVLTLGTAPCHAQTSPRVWRTTTSLQASEAGQAAAADEKFVYAIGNRTIGKYDRRSGMRIASSTGTATHLNSGFSWRGKLYCAHSNYPEKPERSEILVLDPESMKLTEFHRFIGQEGSLTWAVWHDGSWWCNFAFYDADNEKSYLARFDDQWRETARWTYPPQLLEKIGRHSLSGGLWYQGQLLATDHDNPVVYRLKVPADASVLELVDAQPAPFAGQGIAYDPVTGGLVGIVRKTRSVVFAEQRPADNK